MQNTRDTYNSNVSKNRMDFPVQVQSITNKTEAITRGMIQDKNRE